MVIHLEETDHLSKNTDTNYKLFTHSSIKKNDGRIHQTTKSFTLESGVVRFLLNRVLRGPNWNAVVL